MSSVYIIHGWDGNPDEPMIKWLKESLEEKGYWVSAPLMPESEAPKINAWVGKIQEIAEVNKDTIFVGHSIGCQAILRFIEQLPDEVKINKLVLIAPWMELDRQTIEEEGEEVIEIARPWMGIPINFEKVKKHVGKVVAIFSDNDPYVPLNQKDLFEKELGAEVIIENKKGHFTISDNVKELPSALEEICR